MVVVEDVKSEPGGIDGDSAGNKWILILAGSAEDQKPAKLLSHKYNFAVTLYQRIEPEAAGLMRWFDLWLEVNFQIKYRFAVYNNMVRMDMRYRWIGLVFCTISFSQQAPNQGQQPVQEQAAPGQPATSLPGRNQPHPLGIRVGR